MAYINYCFSKLHLFTHSKTARRIMAFATGWFIPRTALSYFPRALGSKQLIQVRWISPFSPQSLRCLRSNGLYSSEACFWTLHVFIHQTCYSKLVVFINNKRSIQISSIQVLRDLYSNTLYNPWNTDLYFMFLWPCIVSKAWRKNTNKMQQYRWLIVNCRCWLLTTVSTCFGHLYAHHQEKRPRVTAYGVYLLVVLDVAGCSTLALRCRVWALWRLLFELSLAATFTVLTPYNVAPQYRNLPHPTLPANTLHMQ